MTEPKQTFNYDQPLIVPEKWLMGVTNLQVCNSFYRMIQKSIRYMHYMNKTLKVLRIL